MNVDAVAFLTTRTPAPREGEARPVQLVVGFAAASPSTSGSIMPLSLVMESDEARDFLDQLGARGVVTDHLREKLA